MQPRLLRAVPISVRPVKRAGTALDPDFGVPIRGVIYGDPIRLRAQVKFQTYRMAEYHPEGDVPQTSGTALVMAEALPVGIDLREALVERVGDVIVNLIVADVLPFTFNHRGQATTYRLDLREAWQTFGGVADGLATPGSGTDPGPPPGGGGGGGGGPAPGGGV